MISETLNDIFEQAILERTKEIQEELLLTKNNFVESQKELINLKSENKDLKLISNQIDIFKDFKNLINENNFEQLINILKLETTDIHIDGMDTDCLPLWFKLLIRYYPSRDILFSMMDMFNIKYPEYAKIYKMPYEYNQEEINVFFNTLINHYVCNGCIFENNIGFYYKEFVKNKFDVIKCLKHQYSELPWQLVLKNPLLVKEENFKKIIKSLKKGESNSYYFFKIQDYQDISEEQAKEMFKYIPLNNLYDVHKFFISKNKFTIKENKDVAKIVSSKISDNKYSTFYFINYPLDMQIEFVKNYNGSYYKKLDLIKTMEISKEDKIKLLIEVSKQEIN